MTAKLWNGTLQSQLEGLLFQGAKCGTASRGAHLDVTPERQARLDKWCQALQVPRLCPREAACFLTIGSSVCFPRVMDQEENCFQPSENKAVVLLTCTWSCF